VSTPPVTGVRRRIWPDLDQLVLRGLVVVGALLPLVAAAGAGATTPGWLQLLVLGFALVTAVRPESLVGVLLLVSSAAVWALVPESTSPLVLVAAAGLVLSHVAALLAAQGPARMHVDPVQAWRWTLRSLGLVAAAAAVWAIGPLLRGAPDGRVVYAGGLLLLTGLAVTATWLLGVRRDRL
jgi:hypothetical protein